MALDIILLIIIGIAVVLAIYFLARRHKKCGNCPYNSCEYHRQNHNFNCDGCKNSVKENTNGKG